MRKLPIKEKFDKLGEDGLWLESWNSTDNQGQIQRHIGLSTVRWRNLKDRCKVGGRFQEKRPSYIGTKNLFRDFQDFVTWSVSEVGYDKYETIGDKSWVWSLDKDILSHDSKVYSPETCLFVPASINCFLTLRQNGRGAYPIGVSYHSKTGKYMSRCSDGNSELYLGLYDTPSIAHKEWQKKKIDVGQTLVEKFKDYHPKLSAALANWCDKVESQFTLGVETK